jgi:decaprenylphospho-beta-D-ribofuranose 2-oxidase
MQTKRIELSGWGRFPSTRQEVARPERYAGLRPAGNMFNLGRGMGRSYGDAALCNDGVVILTERVNRLLDFDAETGLLHAEAGVTLEDILRVFLPRGWFLPVTPGTRYVTLGGCLASDGSFSNHVEAFELLTTTGERLHVTPENNPEAFWATAGGMGLTGMIGEIWLKLQRIESAWMQVRHYTGENLDALFGLMADDTLDDDYSVAWIDCLARGDQMGRGVLMTAHHAAAWSLDKKHKPFAQPGRVQRALPFDLPGGLLNRLSVSAFNAIYYRRQARRDEYHDHLLHYFYPLDSIGHWNRMYGRRGFIQHQCVIPEDNALDGIKALLSVLQHYGLASFLAVLKRFGAGGSGHLSFPMPGYTLAVDLPISGDAACRVAADLNAVVLEHGGRVYLAKDACLAPDEFRAMYPRYPEWLDIKRQLDPDGYMRSDLGVRLRIGEP